MNQTATQPLTTLEREIATRASTNMPFFSALEPLETATIPTFTELLAEYKASVDKPIVAWSDLNHDELAVHNALSQTNSAEIHPQPVRWLWQKRLPLGSFTLLDGDHGCGKSLLALQIAACVSSGHPLPDGTPTIQGGVVIVAPNTDAATAQLQVLIAMGADLSRVEILSYIQESAPEPHTGGYHPFTLPEDLLPLFQAIKRVDARLVIFDPFISLLSRNFRYTNERLGHLLSDLNQRFIERNIACLLIRNCPAKGGHARPTVLERSDHFLTIATSRLLLTPDPMQPDRLLLSHESNHTAPTPTLILQIRPSSNNPDIPNITLIGSHSLKARDFIEKRPDTLHRQLLSKHLLHIIAETTEPIPVSTLYTLSPNSSPFQIQRSLSDLLHMGQIERPARGFYSAAPANPIFPENIPTAKKLSPEPADELKSTAARAPSPEPTDKFNSTAAKAPSPQPAKALNSIAATTPNVPPASILKPCPNPRHAPGCQCGNL